jgi:transcriptional regulator with XRE-family HTH domain
MANRFGERIKQLREQHRLLQRQVAGYLEIDGPMLSKIECGERKAKKEQLPQFSRLLKVSVNELLTLWLADQVVEVVEGESMARKAIQVAEEEVKYHKRKKI